MDQKDASCGTHTFRAAKLLSAISTASFHTVLCCLEGCSCAIVMVDTTRNENLASIMDVRNMPHFADPAWKEEFGATWVPKIEKIHV